MKTKKKGLKRIELTRCSPVFLDKISFTMGVKSCELAEIKKRIKKYTRFIYETNFPYYRYSYGINLDQFKGDRLGIQLQLHRKSEKSDFRCEFNPGSKNFTLAASWLNKLLPHGYSNLLDRCSITRVDVTTDISGAQLEDLLFHIPRAQTNQVLSGRNGLETLYIGRREGERSLVIYDKIRQLRKKIGRGTNPEDIPKVPTTRVEFRLKRIGSFQDLAKLENQFTNVNIYDLKKIPNRTTEYRLFIDSCRFRGCNNSLKLMDLNERRFYKQKLSDHSVRWWNPEKVWNGWESAVARLNVANQNMIEFE